jgi:hypothetical protein
MSWLWYRLNVRWLVVIHISSVRVLSLIILGLVWWVVIHRRRVTFNHTYHLNWATVLVHVYRFRPWFVAIRDGRVFRMRVVLLVSWSRFILITIWRWFVPWMF